MQPLYYDTNTGSVQETHSGRATYWIGADGNIYYGSGQQGADVQNLGRADGTNGGQFIAREDGLYDRFADPGTTRRVYAATQIEDPNGTSSSGSSAPSATGSAGPVLNTGAITNTQRTIDEIPALLQAALEAEGRNYTNTVNTFNQQEEGQRKQYGESTNTNQLNYDSNFMDAIRAGIRGFSGVMSLLRGTGAGGGTAVDQARDTVGGVTANDIRTGADTRNENQALLDNSLSTFVTDLQRKRQMNEDTKVNNERAVRRGYDTQLQELFGQMAGYYNEGGQTAQANDWMTRAGELTPRIAQNSRAQVSEYDTTPVQVRAPELTAFSGATQPNIVSATPQRVGSGIFTISDRRREREERQPASPLLAGA